LFGRHVVSLEIAGLILLVAVVAVVLATRRPGDDTEEAASE
jgi:NADH:ubiquinone oxidoreductase subunit 6 (subunit J)